MEREAMEYDVVAVSYTHLDVYKRQAMSGVRLVMPGPALDGKSVYDLMRDEKVTLALGVPTVWLMLLQHVDAAGLQPKEELCLRRVVIGGSSAPRAMSECFETRCV